MYKHMKWRRMEDPLGVTHLETYDWRRLGLVISHLWAWTFALVHAIQWQRHERKAHQRQGSLDMHGMHPHVYMRPWRLWCRHMRPWRRWCRHALRQGREKKKMSTRAFMHSCCNLHFTLPSNNIPKLSPRCQDPRWSTIYSAAVRADTHQRVV